MRFWPCLSLRSGLLCLAWAALSTGAGFAQSALRLQWKQALASRFQFEAGHPAAAKIFRGEAVGTEAASERDSQREATGQDDFGPRGWSLLSQALETPSTRPRQADSLVEILAQRWAPYPGWLHEAAQTAYRAGAPGIGDALELGLRRALLTQGYQRTPELAMADLWEARGLMRERRYGAADSALTRASDLDPTCAWIPLLRLENSLRVHGLFSLDLGEAWDNIGEVFRLQRFYDNQFTLWYNLLRGLWSGAVLFGFVVLVVLFARYFTRLTHPWAERLPGTVNLKLRYTALALIALSVGVAGVGVGLLALVAFPWIWPHANRGERAVMRWLWIGLFLTPVLLMAERSFLRPLDPHDGLHDYHLAYTDGFDPLVLGRLSRQRGEDAADSAFRYLALSLQYKKQGNTLRALEFADSVPASPSTQALLDLQKANVAMTANEYARADKLYRQAEASAADRVELWFNSSQAALFENNSAANKRYLDKAAEIDAPTLTHFLKENDALFSSRIPPNRRVMDPMLRIGRVAEGTLKDALQLRFLTLPIPAGMVSVPGGLWLLACVISFAAILIRSRNTVLTRGKNLFECKICGKIMCRTCRKGVHCEACFKSVSGISEAKMRSQLVQRLRTRSQAITVLQFRVLNVLFPGTGWLFLGRTGIPALWTLAAAMLLAWIYQLCHLLIEYPAFVSDSLSILPWVFLIGLYALSILKSWLSRGNALALLTAGEGGESP